LYDCVRSADTPARLGGDEFAVLLHGPIDERGVQTALDRIRAELDRPVDLGSGRSAKVGASIGVCFSGSDTDLDDLIRRADLAMYTAKRRGRGISVFYSPDLEPEDGQPGAAPVITPAV
jgi:diguanylate cyclase (GGDEF)-like protein